MKWAKEVLNEREKLPNHVRIIANKAVEKAEQAAEHHEETLKDMPKVKDKDISFTKGDEQPGPEKIAIVRCETVSEVCPGAACFKAFNNKKRHFKEYDNDAEIIGFFTCGGCPGRRVSRLVKSLIKHGLTTVHLSSCMMLDSDYPPCPHIEEIRKSIESKGLKVVQGTHH